MSCCDSRSSTFVATATLLHGFATPSRTEPCFASNVDGNQVDHLPSETIPVDAGGTFLLSDETGCIVEATDCTTSSTLLLPLMPDLSDMSPRALTLMPRMKRPKGYSSSSFSTSFLQGVIRPKVDIQTSEAGHPDYCHRKNVDDDSSVDDCVVTIPQSSRTDHCWSEMLMPKKRTTTPVTTAKAAIRRAYTTIEDSSNNNDGTINASSPCSAVEVLSDCPQYIHHQAIHSYYQPRSLKRTLSFFLEASDDEDEDDDNGDDTDESLYVTKIVAVGSSDDDDENDILRHGQQRQ
jgi:hypothetical protein